MMTPARPPDLLVAQHRETPPRGSVGANAVPSSRASGQLNPNRGVRQQTPWAPAVQVTCPAHPRLRIVPQAPGGVCVCPDVHPAVEQDHDQSNGDDLFDRHDRDFLQGWNQVPRAAAGCHHEDRRRRDSNPSTDPVGQQSQTTPPRARHQQRQPQMAQHRSTPAKHRATSDTNAELTRPSRRPFRVGRRRDRLEGNAARRRVELEGRATHGSRSMMPATLAVGRIAVLPR